MSAPSYVDRMKAAREFQTREGRLWTDAELAAAHALVSAVMTPAEPAPRRPPEVDTPIAFELSPQRAAFDQRERVRHRELGRKYAKRARIGQPDAQGTYRNGSSR